MRLLAFGLHTAYQKGVRLAVETQTGSGLTDTTHTKLYWSIPDHLVETGLKRSSQMYKVPMPRMLAFELCALFSLVQTISNHDLFTEKVFESGFLCMQWLPLQRYIYFKCLVLIKQQFLQIIWIVYCWWWEPQILCRFMLRNIIMKLLNYFFKWTPIFTFGHVTNLLQIKLICLLFLFLIAQLC